MRFFKAIDIFFNEQRCHIFKIILIGMENMDLLVNLGKKTWAIFFVL